MDRTTALSAAGAFTLTTVAAVSALSLTVGAGADAASDPTDPAVMQPEVVTEYEVVQLDADGATNGGAVPALEPDGSNVVYEVQYVQDQAPTAPPAATYDDDHEYEDDDDD